MPFLKSHDISAINMSIFLTIRMFTFQVRIIDIFLNVTEILRCHDYNVGDNLAYQLVIIIRIRGGDGLSVNRENVNG